MIGWLWRGWKDGFRPLSLKRRKRLLRQTLMAMGEWSTLLYIAIGLLLLCKIIDALVGTLASLVFPG